METGAIHLVYIPIAGFLGGKDLQVKDNYQ